MNRQKHLGRLADEEFDVIVIGGGITGACVAYDASRRGLRVALVEKNDFGAATSAASSKLLHGGIRYLQQARIDKVRESALERIYFQNLVPHLCNYVPFMVPTYKSLTKGRAALFAASMAYRVATAGQNSRLLNREHAVRPAWMIGRQEVEDLVPWLADDKRISGALMLPECHMSNSERVTWSIIQGAAHNGAAIANYVSADSLVTEKGSIIGVSATDNTGGGPFTIRGRLTANCSGPWIGSFANDNLHDSKNPITAFSRGAHLLVRDLDLECAIGLPTTQKIAGVAARGGRHMFLIPWRQHVLVGTSYASHKQSIDDVVPTADDREQLIAGINQAIGSEVITSQNIVHSYAGIYPLVAANVNATVYQGTGEYQVIDHKKTDAVDGYVSVFGAKFTTARILAEKACNLIGAKIGVNLKPCSTRDSPTPSADFGNLAAYRESTQRRYAGRAEPQQVSRLIANFGVDACSILDGMCRDAKLATTLGNGRETLGAEAAHCARDEMVVHLDDFIFRRSGVGTLGNPGTELLRNASEIIGRELHWSDSRVADEVARSSAAFPA